MQTSTKILALLAGCALSGLALAQCTNDATVDAQATPVQTSGNTCGKNLALASICSGGNFTNGTGTSVVQMNFGKSPFFAMSAVSSTAGFNPELAFTTGACSSLSGCTIDDTNGTQTVPASGTDSPSQQVADGATGFVFITDLNTESPGCGDYNLVIVGGLPVKLQAFSVQ
jgi:hypothetical protein